MPSPHNLDIFFCYTYSDCLYKFVLTAYIGEEFRLSRQKAALITTIVSLALCTMTFYSLFGVDFFTIFDSVTANVLMPLGGMFTCIFVVWFMKKGFMSGELTNCGKVNRGVAPVILFMLKYITPLLIFYIFIKNLF